MNLWYVSFFSEQRRVEMIVVALNQKQALSLLKEIDTIKYTFRIKQLGTAASDLKTPCILMQKETP